MANYRGLVYQIRGGNRAKKGMASFNDTLSWLQFSSITKSDRRRRMAGSGKREWLREVIQAAAGNGRMLWLALFCPDVPTFSSPYHPQTFLLVLSTYTLKLLSVVASCVEKFPGYHLLSFLLPRLLPYLLCFNVCQSTSPSLGIHFLPWRWYQQHFLEQPFTWEVSGSGRREMEWYGRVLWALCPWREMEEEDILGSPPSFLAFLGIPPPHSRT